MHNACMQPSWKTNVESTGNGGSLVEGNLWNSRHNFPHVEWVCGSLTLETYMVK